MFLYFVQTKIDESSTFRLAFVKFVIFASSLIICDWRDINNPNKSADID